MRREPVGSGVYMMPLPEFPVPPGGPGIALTAGPKDSRA